MDLHDGYALGNGRMYAIAGLGRDLDLTRKSAVTSHKAPLTRIAWVIGPTYAHGNLGHGWELEALEDGIPLAWETESIVDPTADQPFWGVACVAPTLAMSVTDIMMADQPVLLRRVVLTRPASAPPGSISLRIPVRHDPRNGGPMIMWNGKAAPNDKPAAADDRLQRADLKENAFVMVAAQRALWQEISTVAPADESYRRMFPPRALATGISSSSPDVTTVIEEEGFVVEVGEFAPGETRELAIWLVTASAPDSELESTALRELKRWRGRNVEEVVAEATTERPPPLLTRTDRRDDPLLRSIEASHDLAVACQASSGGVMAHPHMYPMYYVRDQYSLVRLFLARGEHDRAWGILGFHLGMAALFGLQNAYDTFSEPPDPARWPPAPGFKDGPHQVAEVPSYMVIEARDYYRATGDIDRIALVYPRLAYNLRVQQPSRNGLLPHPGDESYTNSPQTKPRFSDEMTDSSLLFIAAAEFMAELADRLGHEADRVEFAAMAQRTRESVMKRLWLADRQHFLYARDESDDPARVDARPALDSLLRWDWLGLGEPGDSVSQGCLSAVLKQLVNPVRVVPEVHDFTTGMDPGYVLYALTRAQDPRMHDAARLVLKYASSQGTYAEYYKHENGVIMPFSANLRPWESGVNATALIQYLIGLECDLPNRRVLLNPHLPEDWPGWTTRAIPLPGEGTLRLRLERKPGDQTELTVQREGGENALQFEVGLGGFNRPLRRASEPLQVSNDKPALARGTLTIAPGESRTATVGMSTSSE